MRVILQRVNKASVSVNDKVKAQIGKGFLLFIAVARSDTQADIEKLARKIITIRIFENNDQKFDKTLEEVKGDILVISQFTLYAEYSKGKRPYFGEASEPVKAKKMYKKFVTVLKDKYYADRVQSGVFAAFMQVESENDGPVTLILDSTEL